MILKFLILISEIGIILNSGIVHSHYIEEDNNGVTNGEIINNIFKNFKNILKEAVVLKGGEEMKEESLNSNHENDNLNKEENNYMENSGNIFLVPISILNDEVDKDLKTDNKDNNNSNKNNKNVPEVKKVEIIKDHKNYKFKTPEEKMKEKENNEGSEAHKSIKEENDEEIKNFVKFIMKGEGREGGGEKEETKQEEKEETKKKEEEEKESKEEEKDDMFNIIKDIFISNKLTKLAQAKQKDIEKGIPFEKSKTTEEKGMETGIFNAEDSYIYKCNFDQDCTNFNRYSPDIASCNKTSRHCISHCFVQKACLEDSDCSSSCGSWCLKDTDMVFGRCVMSFNENDFCMESWRVCNDGLVCNMNSFVCEKPRIPLTFTRIDSQEALLSIIIFLVIAIYLIKSSRTRDFISFFSGYELNEFCAPSVQDYEPLPEYQRTEELDPDEMHDLTESGLLNPPPDDGYMMRNEGGGEEAYFYGYYNENNQSMEPQSPNQQNQTINYSNNNNDNNNDNNNNNNIPVTMESTIPETTIQGHDVSTASDLNSIDEPPPDYEE